MGINFRNPGVLLITAVVGVGGVNAFAELATGAPLLSTDDTTQVQATPDGENTVTVTKDGWTKPISVAMESNYGVSGDLWISGHHTGVDFPARTGTQVRAAAAGTVVTAGPGGKYGNQIVIRHDGKLYSQYAHLSRLDVSAGDKVDAGQQIGLSGSTGNSTGPHLHFEIRTGPGYGSDVNPVPYID